MLQKNSLAVTGALLLLLFGGVIAMAGDPPPPPSPPPEPDGFVLTLETRPEGAGTVTAIPDEDNYADGDEGQIEAVPEDNWEFSHWEGDVTDPSSPTTTVIMDEDKTITAYFIGDAAVEFDRSHYAPGDQAVLAVTDSEYAGEDAIEGEDVLVLKDRHGDTVKSWNALPSAGNHQFEVAFTVPEDIPLGTITAIYADPDDPDRTAEATANVADEMESHHWTMEPDEGWEKDEDVARNLWHLTTRRSYEGDRSWWFGNPATGTYELGGHGTTTAARSTGAAAEPKSIGGRVRGVLNSPVIALGGESQVVVSFWHWRGVEYYWQGSYDITSVAVTFSAPGYRERTVIWQEDSRIFSQRAWEQVRKTVEVPEQASEMQLHFEFDSVDGLNQHYEGWYVDSVQVRPYDEEEVAALEIITQCADLPSGQVGGSYGPIYLSATGGVPRYHWTWDEGVPGLRLDEERGRLWGTPTEAGSYPVEFVVHDRHGRSETLTCEITIEPAPDHLLDEDFSDLEGWDMTGLWHVHKETPDHDGLCFSAPFAYYACEDALDFCTGSRTQGTLTSPEINVSEEEAVLLGFEYFRHVEEYEQSPCSITYVEVQLDGGAWHEVWFKSSQDPSPECGVYDTAFATQGAETMRVRFVFDSIDRFHNKFPGWAINRVVVAPAAGGEPLTTLGTSPDIQAQPRVQVVGHPNPVQQASTVTFSVEGVDVEGLRVEVFNASGQRVWEDESTGNQLEWGTVDNSGRRVANGVYLFLAYVQIDGDWLSTEVDRILILR